MFNILIIDDNGEKIYEIESAIEELGLNINVNYVMEVKQACCMLEKNYYDLVILDVQLPSMKAKGAISVTGGIEILNKITELDSINKPLNIIGITAHDENYNEVETVFNQKLWHLIKYDKSSMDWKNCILNKVIYAYEAKQTLFKNYNISEKRMKVDCAIITAVPNEWNQLLRCGLDWKEYTEANDPTQYYYADFEKEGDVIRILSAKQSQMGMAAASMLTTKIINKFSPMLICMIGIAAGRKGEVKIGDIIVADESWDYGSGKIKPNEGSKGISFSSEIHQLSISASSKEILSKDYTDLLYQIRKKWNEGNGIEVNHDIKVHVGPLASGAAVVQDEGFVTNYILPQNRKLLGIDMETYGVYYATNNASSRKIEAISIKAVTDYADPHKNDDYQHYGSFISSQFLLENIHTLVKVNCCNFER